MTDIARLPVMLPELPHAPGELVLSDDGTVRIEPSEALRDALAEREERALAAANAYGTRLGLTLVVLGLMAVGAGWLAGRTFGKTAGRMLWRRPLQFVVFPQADTNELTVQVGTTAWHAEENFQADYAWLRQLIEEMTH